MLYVSKHDISKFSSSNLHLYIWIFAFRQIFSCADLKFRSNRTLTNKTTCVSSVWNFQPQFMHPHFSNVWVSLTVRQEPPRERRRYPRDAVENFSRCIPGLKGAYPFSGVDVMHEILFCCECRRDVLNNLSIRSTSIFRSRDTGPDTFLNVRVVVRVPSMLLLLPLVSYVYSQAITSLNMC